MNKPLIMLDLNEASRFGGPYVAASRIARSELKKDFNFTFLRFGDDNSSSISFVRLASLVRQIKDQRPDIVHFSGLQLSGFMISVACLIAGNYKSLMTIRGTSADALDLSHLKKIVLALIIEPLTCLFVNSFFCNSRFTEQRLISRFFSYKRLPYVYNLWKSDNEKFTDECKVLSRELFDLSEKDIVVVSTGRVTIDKGYALYCKIVKEVLQHNTSIKFILVGDGKYLETLKTRLSKYIKNKSVICLGFRSDVFKINDLSDIYLNPSLHETLSIATMEAMSAGLPPVVSNEGGLSELVEESKSGFKCEISSPKCFAERIERLSKNKKLRQQMSQLARKRIINAMSEEKIISGIRKAYIKVLND